MNEDLLLIKRKYSEEMMHLCRELFPTILETPGLLPSLLFKYFEPNKWLAHDIKKEQSELKFKNFIMGLIEDEEQAINEDVESPEVLLKKVGYTLYRCTSERDIQRFRVYYLDNEELCTFRGGRLNKCYVFFAVKDGAEKLNRFDFKNPEREDEYGTSVISIQFSRNDFHFLSIKNRYNHNVENPDCTFLNNLDNIVEGLTYSFEKYYGMKQIVKKNDFELPGYVLSIDGKYYKYNYRINDVYYCPNNIIIDNFRVVDDYTYEKERYIVLDYFILDLKEKKIKLYDEKMNDSFINLFDDIKKISIEKNSLGKSIILTSNNGQITIIKIDQENKIVSIKCNDIKKIDNNFLAKNSSLINLEAKNLEEVGDDFLSNNAFFTNLYAPKLRRVGNNFLSKCLFLRNIKLDNLEEVGDSFLEFNQELEEISFKSLKKVGNGFITHNKNILTIDLPNLEEVGNNFLGECLVEKVEFLNLQKIGDSFLDRNNALIEINLPNVIEIGDNFLLNALKLSELGLPRLEKAGNHFLTYNMVIKKVNLDRLKEVGEWFMSFSNVEDLFLPSLEKTGNNFLCCVLSLLTLTLPSLKEVGNEFLSSNKVLNTITVPNLQKVGNKFLERNIGLKNFYAPKLVDIGDKFLNSNIILRLKMYLNTYREYQKDIIVGYTRVRKK